MNPIAEEILMHYGMPRRSGRYPWGSGDNPYQHIIHVRILVELPEHRTNSLMKRMTWKLNEQLTRL